MKRTVSCGEYFFNCSTTESISAWNFSFFLLSFHHNFVLNVCTFLLKFFFRGISHSFVAFEVVGWFADVLDFRYTLAFLFTSDLFVNGREGVILAGGFGTSKSVGTAFHISFDFVFLFMNCESSKWFEHNWKWQSLFKGVCLRSSLLTCWTHFLHLSSSFGNLNIDSVQFPLELWQFMAAQ